MKDDENLRWSMDDIAHQYKIENPRWKWSKCWERAKLVYRGLNGINREGFRDRDKFFTHNTPFSFYDNKGTEFNDLPTND